MGRVIWGKGGKSCQKGGGGEGDVGIKNLIFFVRQSTRSCILLTPPLSPFLHKRPFTPQQLPQSRHPAQDPRNSVDGSNLLDDRLVLLSLY